MSKGEIKIRDILIKEKIHFIREMAFRDLRNGLMRFDFFLPDLNILIEFDGAQHFRYIKGFHKSKKEYQHSKQNDYYKNSYALAHKIPLYRIPYWEENNINEFNDLIQDKFRVTDKWHNDRIYREHIV